MVGKIGIKKELSQPEFDQILSQFRENRQKYENVKALSSFFTELAKQVIPAQEVHILIFLETGKILQTVTLEKSITIDISSSKSILSRSYQTKKALFSNDVTRDSYYAKEIDNFLEYPLKNLLVVPLLNEDKEILGLIWAAIPEKDLNQYMQSDIEYMMQLSVWDKKIIHQREEFQEEKIEENIGQEEMVQENTSSMVKRLKSWMFR